MTAGFVSVFDLARVLHRDPVGGRLMALLSGYFDASHTDHAPEKVSTVGGYVGTVDAWREVEGRWIENLGKWGLNDFHMSKIQAGRTSVRKDMSTACVDSFARILKEARLDGVCAGIRADQWKALDKSPEYAAQFPTPYHVCIDMLLKVINQSMMLERERDSIAIVLDRDIKPDGASDAILNKWRSSPSAHIASITFADSEKCRLLQCADLCAGHERKGWIEVESGAASFSYHFTRHSNRGHGSFWSHRTEEIARNAMNLRPPSSKTPF